MGEVLDLGVKQGLIDKSGAWYAYQGDKIGQGRANAAQYLDEHPAISQDIEQKIRETLLNLGSESSEEAVEEVLAEA
jgi:recombination protein RecA